MKVRNFKLKISWILLVSIIIISLYPKKISSWNQEQSTSADDYQHMYFTTHQWLAYEAIKLEPTQSKMAWLTSNLHAFWLGVEAPYNELTASFYGLDDPIYGDINELILFLDGSGTIVTNDSLADRAQEEYDKLITELAKNDTDYQDAAFYAGTMSHYISQAGIWATLWNETLWGSLDTYVWNTFENQIDYSLSADYYHDEKSSWLHDNFTLTPNMLSPVDAYNATVNLAKTIHPYAESLGNDFDEFSWYSVYDWSASYFDKVEFCLNASVEAIYASLKHAMEAVDLKYITIAEIDYSYDNTTHSLEIYEFNVNYTDSYGTFNLNDSTATQAEFGLLEDTDLSYEEAGVIKALQYNAMSNKWYQEKCLLNGTTPMTDYKIYCQFKLNGSALTKGYSNSTFSVDYYDFIIDDFEVLYDLTSRKLSISNVQCYIPDLVNINYIEPNETTSANWFLYQKGVGSSISNTSGVPKYDTEGKVVYGNLTYNGMYWTSFDNDIGLVYTPSEVDLYVIIRFTLVIPTGYLYEDNFGGWIFRPYAQKIDDYVFETSDHIATITIASDPILDTAFMTVSLSEITAYVDYNNTVLDYYEIREKEVYGSDIREARWKIFSSEGIASQLTGDLQWDDFNDWWYINDIQVGNLPDGVYKIGVKFTTMNIDFTSAAWEFSSEFTIKTSETPIYIYLLPMAFLIGFIAIPAIIFAIVRKRL
jgi:hypothetical protein